MTAMISIVKIILNKSVLAKQLHEDLHSHRHGHQGASGETDASDWLT